MENINQYTNIAYYKFVAIENPSELRQTLLDLCLGLNLKGTIILAYEGINSCLVGAEQSIEQFIQFMHKDLRFTDIEFKKSVSNHIPFRRMLVKIKKEVIPLGMESIKPAEHTGKYIEPLELKQWFDNKEDFVVLDTRNNYEVDIGTFRGAINPNLTEFRNFPKWVKENFSQYKNKKIVTFCTGGIRCEKATAFMQQEGFENVYQVKGGIIKYFEETAQKAPAQDNHYDGDCFVFDYRVAVDKNLEQSKYCICYNCWRTLTAADLEHENYKKDTYCPHCHTYYLQRERSRKKIMEENNLKSLQVRKERAQEIRKALLKEEAVSFPHP
ncbi:MAG: rhodanese-related sulfurtransferase [Bdellovibrionota bacterium]